jgi:Flp pilus assembly protein TadG
MRSHAGLRDCRGQALVEFALCTVLLLAVLFSVIEFGRLMLVYTTIGNAARIGARYAIAHDGDSTGTQTIANGFLHAGTVNTSNSTVTVSLPGYPDGSSANCTLPGCLVTVTITYPYDPLLSYFSLGSINLTSSSQGVITW